MPRTPNFQLLFESAPALYLVLTTDFRITAASDAYLQATMTTRQGLLGRHMFDAFPDNPAEPGATGVNNLRASLNRVLQGKQPDAMALQKYDIRRPAAEGAEFEERFWSPINSPVIDERGEVQYIIHRVEDVTSYVRLKQLTTDQRMSMEAELHLRGEELQRTNERLRRSLAEKDVLLKEIHHRVKNNLEVVNSLLSLQSDRIVDETARELLDETANRVRAIADIHRLLYTSPDLVHVDIGRFLASVSESLFSFYGVRPDRVRLIVETNDSQVNVQQAVPIGLILNELLSNALKHAFPEGRSGSIQIQLCSHGDRGVLSVTDDGVGFPSETKLTSSTLGLELVRVLVDQLHGQLEQFSAPGTRYRITFSLR